MQGEIPNTYAKNNYGNVCPDWDWLKVRPEYSDNRISLSQSRIDKLLSVIKVDHILVIGDTDFHESKYFAHNGFKDILSTDYMFVSNGQMSLDIEHKYLDKQFNLIHASHVLEHLFSPILGLDNMKKMLNRDGVISIFVPEENRGWDEPYHLYSFSFEGWTRLIKRIKLKIIHKEVIRHPQIEYFYLLKSED